MPAESEKLVCELKKKLEQLEGKKKKEDEKLAEVMESLKTETKGMQEEKEKKEEELLALQKNVNETKSKVFYLFFVNMGKIKRRTNTA